MLTLKLSINDQILSVLCPHRLVVAESEGQVFCSVDADAEWDGLAMTMTFDNDFATRPYSVIVTDRERIPVPHEVLVTGNLRIGIEGTRDGLRLVTKDASPVKVWRAGPLVGVSPEPPTPELWEQILSMIGDLSDLDTVDKSSLVAAINELAAGGGGGGVSQQYVDDKDAETLRAAKDYADSTAPMDVEIEDDGFGGYRTVKYNDNDINNHRNGGGVVQAKYYDQGVDQTYTYYYSTMESDRRPTFTRTYIDPDTGETVQVLATVGNDKKVTVARRKAAGGGSKDLGITGATVGQIVTVGAVDGSGNPTGYTAITPADTVEQDNTLPVTSAAVYTEVGNIEALLGTI